MTEQPRYTLWQAMHAAVQLSLRAIEEVRALARQPGPPGPAGEPGRDGKLSLCRAWAGGTVHYEGQVVTHGGGTYQAARDTGHEPGANDDWLCLAAPGQAARGVDVKGTFDAAAEYRQLDIVALNGGSFVALKDEPGACPGPGWQLLASAGKRGRDGQPGERGARGEPGERGEPGAVIAGWKVEAESYRATPVLTDGTLAEPLDLRALFEQFHAEAAR